MSLVDKVFEDLLSRGIVLTEDSFQSLELYIKDQGFKKSDNNFELFDSSKGYYLVSLGGNAYVVQELLH